MRFAATDRNYRNDTRSSCLVCYYKSADQPISQFIYRPIRALAKHKRRVLFGLDYLLSIEPLLIATRSRYNRAVLILADNLYSGCAKSCLIDWLCHKATAVL